MKTVYESKAYKIHLKIFKCHKKKFRSQSFFTVATAREGILFGGILMRSSSLLCHLNHQCLMWLRKWEEVQIWREPSGCVQSIIYYITYLLTYLLTHSTVQSPSWEANWFAASQEIPHIWRNPTVHYRTHNRPPPVSILGQPNPVHIPTSHLLEIHPKIIHPSTPRSPQWSPSLRFPHQYPIHPPLLTHTRHMPSPSHTSRFYHRTILGEQYKLLAPRYAVSSIPPLPRPS